MSTRMVDKQRPAKKFQGRVQRLSFRDNPEHGIVWGQEGWPDGGAGPVVPPAAGDKTADIASTTGVDPASLADLAAIQADATLGDGTYTGGAFAADQYVVLGDGSQATWDGSAWTAFTAPSPPPPAPTPNSGWTKAEIIDWLNDHGDPAQSSLTKDELLDHVEAILSP